MSERALEAERARDTDAELRERDAFALLLHVLNLTNGRVDRQLGEARLARDLALDPVRADQLLDYLETIGYVSRPWYGRVRLTSQGLDYLQRLARHRRSVRRPRAARVLRPRG